MTSPVEKKAASAFVISLILSVLIVAGAVYYGSFKILLGLLAPLYLAFMGLNLLASRNDIKEIIATLASVVPSFLRGIKLAFVDDSGQYYEFLIQGKKTGDFSLGATYKVYYNEKTKEFVTCVLYDATDDN